MKKLILLLALPLWMMPAYAQQKKKTVKKKRTHTAVPKMERPKPKEDEGRIDDGVPDVAYSHAPPIFRSVEQMPVFRGGDAALMKFIAGKLRYPDEASEKDIQGRVVVQFVIRATGQVTDAVVLRDIGFGCGKEALRVVNAMPAWEPGKQNGRAVDVYYTLPVTFKLMDDTPPPQQQR